MGEGSAEQGRKEDARRGTKKQIRERNGENKLAEKGELGGEGKVVEGPRNDRASQETDGRTDGRMC